MKKVIVLSISFLFIAGISIGIFSACQNKEPSDEKTLLESTQEPTAVPKPTIEPTVEPKPTVVPTVEPPATPEPTVETTAEPVEDPTKEPDAEPTQTVTKEPTFSPTVKPTVVPATKQPTKKPVTTPKPTVKPTKTPVATKQPTKKPVTTPKPTQAADTVFGVKIEKCKITMYTIGGGNIRTQPNTSSACEVLGKLRKDQEVVITGKCANGFWQYTYEGQTVYTQGKYFTDVAPEPEQTEADPNFDVEQYIQDIYAAVAAEYPEVTIIENPSGECWWESSTAQIYFDTYSYEYAVNDFAQMIKDEIVHHGLLRYCIEYKGFLNLEHHGKYKYIFIIHRG